MRFVIFFCIIVFSLSLFGCAFVTIPLKPGENPLQEKTLEGGDEKKILLIDISGTISEQGKSGGLLGEGSPSMVSLVHESLKKAESDKEISALILRINSPGGTVTASDIIYHDIIEFKKKKKIPVIACIMSTGTSGGYYVAAAADEIVAHPTSITGSIGVITIKFNVSGLMAKIGLEEQTVKSGDKKDIMSPFRRATPEEEKLGQEIIDQLYNRFLDVIMSRNGNKLSREVLKKLADGRVYTAWQALDVKLIDRIDYLDSLLTNVRKSIGSEDAKVITYYRPGNYKGSIYAEGAQKEGVFEMFNDFDIFTSSSFMYLWRP